MNDVLREGDTPTTIYGHYNNNIKVYKDERKGIKLKNKAQSVDN